MVPNRSNYRCGLGFTSQFYFCSLPLRLDPYSQCSFGCRYCFAAERGGARRGRGLQVLDVDALERQFNRISEGKVRTAVDQLLAQGQPLHIGGMSDPFVRAEQVDGITLRTLNLLATIGHSAVISTKGVELLDDRYLDVLARGRFIVQVSLSSVDDSLMKRIDLRAPSPTRRIAAMRDLTDAGVPVTVRVQPLLPSRERDAEDVIEASAQAGARHAAFEHLKLGVESWKGTDALSATLGLDVVADFRRRGAERVGRKWILPITERLPRQLHLRDCAHRSGLSFAAADSDLLLLSDGGCCCSGADLIAGFNDYYRFNYVEAVRLGLADNRIDFGRLAHIWRPSATISSHVNSQSRLPAVNGRGAGVESYIRHNWNGRPNGHSPLALWGVSGAEELDRQGLAVYRVESEARSLYMQTQQIG